MFSSTATLPGQFSAVAVYAPRRSRRAPVSAATGRKSVVTRAEGLFDKIKEIIPSTEEGVNDGRGGRKMTKGSIIELMGMGAGLPMPSDIEIDKENVKVIMSFESNNFDLQGKYRDEGWVDDTPSGPGFWESLFGKKKEAEEDK